MATRDFKAWRLHCLAWRGIYQKFGASKQMLNYSDKFHTNMRGCNKQVGKHGYILNYSFLWLTSNSRRAVLAF